VEGERGEPSLLSEENKFQTNTWEKKRKGGPQWHQSAGLRAIHLVKGKGGRTVRLQEFGGKVPRGKEEDQCQNHL